MHSVVKSRNRVASSFAGWLHRSLPGLLAALLITGCFERGKARDRTDDAAATAPVVRWDAQVADQPETLDPAATIRVSLEAEPPHLNPLLGDALAARIALGDVYEGLLCEQPETLAAEPCLARSVEVDATGTVWTFSLRSGVRWHDGKPLSAQDVRFTFGLLSSGAPSLLASELDDLTSLEIEGDRIVFRFSGVRVGRDSVFARVPILPAHRFAGVVPARLAAAPASREPVGTGPLAFASWKPGESIALSRASGYWGERATSAHIIYKMYTGREQTLTALRAGDLDVAVQIPVDEAITASAGGDIEIFAQAMPGYYAAVYNTERIGEPSTRRALTMLLDRDQIAREVFRDQVEIVSGPFRSGSAAVDPSVSPLPYSPGEAARALGDRVPKLSVAIPAGSRTMARIADIWAADARPRADLRVEVVPYAQLLDRAAAGKFDIALLAFTTALDLDLYPSFHSSQKGQLNFSRLSDSTVDDLVTRVRAEPSRERRDAMSRQLHKRLHELAPYAFISNDTRLGLRRIDVGGVVAGPSGLAARRLGKRGAR